MKKSSLIGVLLAQIGTPSAPTAKAVRPYLHRFLSDRRVIDYSPLLWQPLLCGMILTVRPRKSAKLYRQIWTRQGSPLLLHSLRQQEGLQQRLGGVYKVELGFAYSNPDIREAMHRLEAAGAERILVLPLFPQYSSTTTAAVYDAACFAALGKSRSHGSSAKRFVPALRLAEAFFDHPGYIRAMQEHLAEQARGLAEPPERFVLSFHGIPQRYADTGDPYPQQCQETAQRLAEAMGWSPERWAIAYQSRFGPEPWLGPTTEEVLRGFTERDAARTMVFAPGFAADCLETIYELGVEARHHLMSDAAGSLNTSPAEFRLAPCLNDHPAWLDFLADFARDSTAGWGG
ncbi:ferrochelatase [Paenibacillus sanguinis]|uniref:ferrochelatase n=1 Tax=Paenibacillus sanguinis TaxID=225906 RepID=UPI00036CAA19|nr:ferrochelatase [Paenibacillus sanguinis]